MTLLAAIYVRTAATNATALDHQLQACRDHLLALDMTEGAVFAEVGSGASARAGLLAGVASGAFDVLVVASPDRLSRELGEVVAISEELRCLGVEIHVAGFGPLFGMGGLHRALAGQPERPRGARNQRRARRLRSVEAYELSSDSLALLSSEGTSQ